MSADPNIQADEVLYHYCSAESFLSIIQKRAVWLSGISLAKEPPENDGTLSESRADFG